MDYFGERNQLMSGVGPVGKVGDRPLFDYFLHSRIMGSDGGQPVAGEGDPVQRRHINSGHGGQPEVHLVAVAPPSSLPCGDDLGDFPNHLLAVAQHRGVNEVGQRLGVVGAVSTDNDQRVGRRPISGSDRHTRQVNALKQVRVEEFGREVESQHVELGGRPVSVD